MRKIEMVPFLISGTNDTVEMLTECGIARFRTGIGGKTELKGTPEKCQCRIIASRDRGLFGVMTGEKKFFVSVRLDEVLELIKAADEACGNVGSSEDSADVQESTSSQG